MMFAMCNRNTYRELVRLLVELDRDFDLDAEDRRPVIHLSASVEVRRCGVRVTEGQIERLRRLVSEQYAFAV